MNNSSGMSRLIVELPASIKNKFIKKCAKLGTTMSDEVRVLVSEFIRKDVKK